MKAFSKIKAIPEFCKGFFLKYYEYCISGVWNETRNVWWVNLLKTVNLSVSSFMDKNLQQKAGALTYRTILTIVPILAMIFAIGRGFGFQNIIQSELFKFFPSQREALSNVLTFVDSYLAQSSQGLFLGIGIVFLLWSLIGLLGNVEDAFNHIWGEKKGRSFYRKLTDYTAIFMILPILIICSSGISIFMRVTISGTFLSPILGMLFDIAPWVLICAFFTGAFILIPNTRVKFLSALIPGVLCGTAFQVLQWLFVSGQIYVSKYNAIYGSFAFVPLMLIWLQLSWLICLSGVVISYSCQNIFRFNFRDDIKNISQKYGEEVSIIILGIIVRKFSQKQKEQAYTKAQLSDTYNVPIRLVGKVIDRLVKIGLLAVVVGEQEREFAYIPAFDVEYMTVENVCESLRSFGKSDFIDDFNGKFSDALQLIEDKVKLSQGKEMLIKDLPINIK